LDYTRKKVNCKRGEPKDEELCKIFATLAPGGADATVTVPLLQHESKKGLVQIIESGHCAEYINDLFPGRRPLWPRDLKQRVAVRQLTEVGGNCGFMFPMFTPPEAWPEKLADHAAKLKLLDNCLKIYSTGGGDFLLGPNMCMAEVMLAPMVVRWHKAGLLKGFDGLKLVSDLGLERTSKWCQAVINRDAVKDTYPDPDPANFETLKVSYDVVDGKVSNVVVKA